MEDGGRGSDGGVGSKSSLTWACRCLCPFIRAGRRSWAVVFVHVQSVFVRVHSFLLVGVHRCPWVFVSVSGCSSSFVGAHFRLWVAGFVRAHVFWYCGAPLGGWWILVAICGVVVWWLVVCRLSLWVV